MPYIPKKKRVPGLEPTLAATWVGTLAYQLFSIVKRYWILDPSYQSAVEIIGALETVKHEFQRRYLDPYEDRKREENGDV